MLSTPTTLLLRRFDDRIVARVVESEQIPRLLHVRWHCRGSVYDATARMRHHDPARKQMQAVLHAAGQLPVLFREVFGIAHNGMADMRHVGAQLMGAAGYRLERE